MLWGFNIYRWTKEQDPVDIDVVFNHLLSINILPQNGLTKSVKYVVGVITLSIATVLDLKVKKNDSYHSSK